MNSSPTEADLRRNVAELLVVRASGHLEDRQRRYPRWELTNADLQRLLEQGVGGVILLGGSAAELQQRTQRLQAWATQPLLLCADVEEGVGQRFEGASWLVPPRPGAPAPEKSRAGADSGGTLRPLHRRSGSTLRSQLGVGACLRCQQQPRQSGDQCAGLG